MSAAPWKRNSKIGRARGKTQNYKEYGEPISMSESRPVSGKISAWERRKFLKERNKKFLQGGGAER